MHKNEIAVAVLDIKGVGNGGPRYGREVTKYFMRFHKNIKIIEPKKLPLINPFLSENVGLMLKNYLGYKVIHNMQGMRFHPLLINSDVKFISTAYEFQIPLYNDWDKYTITNNHIKDSLYKLLYVIPSVKLELNSDYLIVISSQTKEEAIKLGFAKNKIFVTNLGIDNRFLKPPKKMIKRSFKVGYIGTLQYRKNVKFLINAFKCSLDKNISLEIFGKGPDYANLENLSRDDPRIKLNGFCAEKEIVNTYDSFDVFAFPSFYEGFGLEIFEAQSRGLPVIIYKYGKIPKEVRKYCLEAKTPEHMAQIIENIKENGYNEKLKKKATGYARSFTWEKCAKETLEVYKKVLEK